MDIRIPKVTEGIDLGDYAVDLRGKFLRVWVNPPLGMLREHDEIMQSEDQDDPKLYEWYARILSQHEDAESHWTAAELQKVRLEDPAFFIFVVRNIWDARRDFMAKKKPS